MCEVCGYSFFKVIINLKVADKNLMHLKKVRQICLLHTTASMSGGKRLSISLLEFLKRRNW